MYRLNDSFNDTGVNMNINTFYDIRNTYNFEVQFGLRKTGCHNIIQFDSIYIFDIFLNSTKIWLKSDLVGGNDKTSMVSTDKISKKSDLIFFKALLMLAMCLPDKDINFEIFTESIGMMICFLE